MSESSFSKGLHLKRVDSMYIDVTRTSSISSPSFRRAWNGGWSLLQFHPYMICILYLKDLMDLLLMNGTSWLCRVRDGSCGLQLPGDYLICKEKHMAFMACQCNHCSTCFSNSLQAERDIGKQLAGVVSVLEEMDNVPQD